MLERGGHSLRSGGQTVAKDDGLASEAEWSLLLLFHALPGCLATCQEATYHTCDENDRGESGDEVPPCIIGDIGRVIGIENGVDDCSQAYDQTDHSTEQ